MTAILLCWLLLLPLLGLSVHICCCGWVTTWYRLGLTGCTKEQFWERYRYSWPPVQIEKRWNYYHSHLNRLLEMEEENPRKILWAMILSTLRHGKIPPRY